MVCMQQAYKDNDWNSVSNLAHKIKGGAVYMGACRLKYACQYMQRYYIANHRSLLKELYKQLLTVYDETAKEIEAWLMKYK